MLIGSIRPRDVLLPVALVTAVGVVALLPRPVASASALAPTAVSSSECDDMARWDGLEPLLSDPTGDIEALWATSEVPGDLTSSDHLYVRVDVKSGVPIHRLLLDIDEDRMTGMWTGQSHLSDAGWDRLIAAEGIGFAYGAAHPDKWLWTGIGTNGITTAAHDLHRFFCVALDALPATDRVRMAVETSWNSMPRRFLAGAAYPPTDEALVEEPVRRPKPMAFYYSGSPWVVGDCTDQDPAAVGCAARFFGRFRHVVFGARLEEETRSGHDGARNLMQKIAATSPGTEMWGYMSFIGSQKNPDGTRDLVFSVEDYREAAKSWKAMGATGVFLDEYDVCDPSWQDWCRPGPDGEGVKLTRERQRKIVDAIHSQGLAVFANSHSVQNALGVVEGQQSPLGAGGAGRPADMYLLENPTVVYGGFQGGIDYEGHQARFAQAVELTQETGARLGVLDSMDRPIPADAYKWVEYRVGWWQAAMAGAAGYAFVGTEPVRLRPPVDALPARGLHFGSEGIGFSANGWATTRAVLDRDDNEIGVIARERLDESGASTAGFLAHPF